MLLEEAGEAENAAALGEALRRLVANGAIGRVKLGRRLARVEIFLRQRRNGGEHGRQAAGKQNVTNKAHIEFNLVVPLRAPPAGRESRAFATA